MGLPQPKHSDGQAWYWLSQMVDSSEHIGGRIQVEGLQSVTKTLSKQRDLELLEVRMQKASAMKSLSDRVTEMGMEAHTQSTRLQMALDEHTGHIGLLETMATTKVSSDTFEKLQGRLDQMEVELTLASQNVKVTLIRKADTETLGKAAQQVTEQARQLESVASHVRDQGSKLEVLEGRSETLKEQILQKAESSNVYTVDGVDGMLHREEMDALLPASEIYGAPRIFSRSMIDYLQPLSRVWWRLGDVAKAPVNLGEWAGGSAAARALRKSTHEMLTGPGELGDLYQELRSSKP
ncbi:hypothetical protein AK812_SmicGene27625 [Symbiodinium microadriaticum]|uniref:Uncharacterized protein n=1 Tax=Symbiodinium microadriaticum TaxID=2951 RepID=A0A1Q9D6G4_SYMMI|nr:hypothetical protein AK812_SmicGene27625 [Symbiodinium microadriaticum]